MTREERTYSVLIRNGHRIDHCRGCRRASINCSCVECWCEDRPPVDRLGACVDCKRPRFSDTRVHPVPVSRRSA